MGEYFCDICKFYDDDVSLDVWLLSIPVKVFVFDVIDISVSNLESTGFGFDIGVWSFHVTSVFRSYLK